MNDLSTPSEARGQQRAQRRSVGSDAAVAMLVSLVSLVQRRKHMRKHGGVLAARGADCNPLAAVQQPLVHYDPIDLLLERSKEAILAELQHSTTTVTDTAQSWCAGAAAQRIGCQPA